MGGQADMRLEQPVERRAGDLLDHGRAHSAAALDQGDDRRLVADVAAPEAALLAADVRFVGLYGAVQHAASTRQNLFEREADALAEEQRRPIGADLKLPL